MKADIWLQLRKNPALRGLAEWPAIGSFIKRVSYWMAPREERTLCTVKSGIAAGLHFELSPRWNMAAWEGTYEQEVQDVLKKIITPGQVLYDIGAGVGYFACAAARLGATVYAFE